VLVRNSRTNLVTQIQEWDYFHGIAAIKRVQSL
jgi:biofilm PGA synthesis N-glycosyltransferase PgaC